MKRKGKKDKMTQIRKKREDIITTDTPKKQKVVRKCRQNDQCKQNGQIPRKINYQN